MPRVWSWGHPWGRVRFFNTPHSTWSALIVSYEVLGVHSLHGRISDMPFQCNQASHSVGLTKPECIALDHPPRVAIHQVDDTGGPSPGEYNFSCVRTLGLFKTLNSCSDPSATWQFNYFNFFTFLHLSVLHSQRKGPILFQLIFMTHVTKRRKEVHQNAILNV